MRLPGRGEKTFGRWGSQGPGPCEASASPGPPLSAALPSCPSAGSGRPPLPVPSEGEPAMSPVSGFLICLIIDEFSA